MQQKIWLLARQRGCENVSGCGQVESARAVEFEDQVGWQSFTEFEVGQGSRIRLAKVLWIRTIRAEQLGRPMLYGTTQKFLMTFGLKSAKDLPPVEELRKKQ